MFFYSLRGQMHVQNVQLSAAWAGPVVQL